MEIMKMLILSDSHGHTDLLRRAIELHQDADSIVFLGDGIADVRACERHFDRPIRQVAGNCDVLTFLYRDTPTESAMVFGEKRILLTHGHRFAVKSGTGNLLAYAALQDYDIVLFGHTHERTESYCASYDKPIYLFNPGSIGHPRQGNPSFGLLQIADGQVLFSHGDVSY